MLRLLTMIVGCAVACNTLQAGEFRLPDDRPALDRARLQASGLNVVESKRLVLVTDLPLDVVKQLPPLADALFEELEQQLGPLLPSRDGRDFQVTGYLMDARERFEQAGVLPSEDYPIRHGRHLGYRFWMYNQTADYYRRHLMLHEFVHCFLMCEFGMQDIPPLWYTEGIAEYFATHQLEADPAKSQFGVLPATVKGFEGWHRISEIQRQFSLEPSVTGELADILPLQTVLHPPDTTFQGDSQYAHAWAIVWLIHHHPELKTRFAAVAAARTRRQFEDAIAKIPAATWAQLDQIWPLYLDGLAEADVSAVRFAVLQNGVATDRGAATTVLPLEFNLEADKQWVSAGLELQQNREYVFECSGRYVVEKTTQPWWSEPDGITIDYVRGRPLGEVIAVIVSPDGASTTRHIPIGKARTLKSPINGKLWLQINDDWAHRKNNEGSVKVRVSAK